MRYLRTLGLSAAFALASCSSSGSGGAGGGAGFSVASLPGLGLWLDAGKGVSATGWADQSGKGIVASSGSMPTVIPTSIHGHPAVFFSAQEMVTDDSDALGMGTGEFLFEVVAKVSSPGAELFGLSSHGDSFAQLGISAAGLPTAHLSLKSASITMTATGTTAAADGKARLFGLRRTGSGASSKVEVRVNGSAQGSTTGSVDLGSSMEAAVAGADTVGDIAEIVVIKGPTSEADLAALESFLKSKYGL